MSKRCGLSITELIVVLAIVAGLLALLLPAVQLARERAREAVCKSHLRQTDFALAQFVEATKQFPTVAPSGVIGGWMVEILPLIEQQNLMQDIPFGLPVAQASEKLFRPPPLYRCPRRTVLDGAEANAMWAGHYVLVRGSGVFDAPVDLKVPWVSSPEMQYKVVVGSKGPHSDGFYCARSQQGIVFIRDGKEVR